MEQLNEKVNQGVGIVNKLDEIVIAVVIAIIKIALIIVFFVILAKLLMALNHRVMRNKTQKLSVTRQETIASIIDDIIKYIISFITFFSILPVLGFNAQVVIASSGFLAIIVGVGGSSFIGDFIDGFFALFEGYYDVGDYIKVGTFEGEVVDIGLKSIILKSYSNELITMPNSALIQVVNLSKLDHIQYPVVSISYDADIKYVEKIINEEIIKNIESIEQVISISYLGVCKLNNHSVDLKFELCSNQKDRFAVERMLNRELKLVFDQNNIEIPYNQMVIHTK